MFDFPRFLNRLQLRLDATPADAQGVWVSAEPGLGTCVVKVRIDGRDVYGRRIGVLHEITESALDTLNEKPAAQTDLIEQLADTYLRGFFNSAPWLRP